MKLASIVDGTRDGRLVVACKNGDRILPAPPGTTLQAALDDWAAAAPMLQELSARLEAGDGKSAAPAIFSAPLPRAWQWLDGSAFGAHGELMQKAFGLDPIETDVPLMYQGMSHVFLGPRQDVPFRSEADGIDFEGEFGVVTDDVPMGVSAYDAMAHIKLVVQINDWSLRIIAPREMKTGFGWVQAKPACSMAPFAVTPDELGRAWRDGQVQLDLLVKWNGDEFGRANGREMGYGFHELVAHAAATRTLCAGTIIGSGTVANRLYAEVGSSCISERRGSEILQHGSPRTPFMSFGDSISMNVTLPDGSSLFGEINQRVIRMNPC